VYRPHSPEANDGVTALQVVNCATQCTIHDASLNAIQFACIRKAGRHGTNCYRSCKWPGALFAKFVHGDLRSSDE
jgi:hypothetical protein